MYYRIIPYINTNMPTGQENLLKLHWHSLKTHVWSAVKHQQVALWNYFGMDGSSEEPDGKQADL